MIGKSLFIFSKIKIFDKFLALLILCIPMQIKVLLIDISDILDIVYPI
jgi:hypothetical protein